MTSKRQACPVCKKAPLPRGSNGWFKDFCSEPCRKRAHSNAIGHALYQHRRAKALD